MGGQRFKLHGPHVHSVHVLSARARPTHHVDNVDHMQIDCPHCPQSGVYTVVYVHTVVSLPASCCGLSTVSTHILYADDPYADDPYADDPYANDPYANNPYADDPYADDPYADDPYADSLVRFALGGRGRAERMGHAET